MWTLEEFPNGDWMVLYVNVDGECWCHLASWFHYKAAPLFAFKRISF